MSEINPLNQYPEIAENYWHNFAEQITGLKDEEALEKITPSVARLSDLFTVDRPEKKFPNYFSDNELLSAYGLFFLPQSFIRTTYALRFITEARQWKAPSNPLRILDLGSGPGSCGVACAHYFKELGVKELELNSLDHSATALAALEPFAAAVLGNKYDVKTRIGDAHRAETWPEGPFDIIIAGFVLNEMKSLSHQALIQWIESMKDRLTPDGLILILEPALKITSQRLQKLSDEIAAQDIVTRIGPELDAHPCPQLADGVHWSHEVRHWQIPTTTEFINRKLHRDLRDVRFTFAAFSNQKVKTMDSSAIRIVSDIQIMKGLLRFIGVQNGQLQTVEVSTRGLSKHDVKLLAAKFERGDIVSHSQPPASKVRLSDSAGLQTIWAAQPRN
jgi:SAM-dependent methyltransferase